MKAPWHLWVVGIVTLAWNAMGAFDYYMTQTRNADYLAMFTAEQLAYFFSFPAWVQGSWAIAVWASVLGSILLLMRNRNAPIVFAVSFAAMAVTSLHNFVLAEVTMADIMGPEAMYFSAAIFVVALLTYLYARGMRRDGILH